MQVPSCEQMCFLNLKSENKCHLNLHCVCVCVCIHAFWSIFVFLICAYVQYSKCFLYFGPRVCVCIFFVCENVFVSLCMCVCFTVCVNMCVCVSASPAMSPFVLGYLYVCMYLRPLTHTPPLHSPQ